ncbi:MAG: preprotein translocase subunit SecD [Frankiaceae bacterium]|nr:preprotein translocase subunit SecD [Frankiaceae bacterium]
MSDLETRLRALADAASAVTTQPTTDELLARPRPLQRKWLPVTAIAAATAGIIALVGIHPWSASKSPATTSSIGAQCASDPVAFRLSGGSLSVADLLALVGTRLGALTKDGCVEARPGGAVDVRLGATGRAVVTSSSLRGEFFVAPVMGTCARPCEPPPTNSLSGSDGAHYVLLPGSDGARYVLDVSHRLDLSGHLVRASAGLVPQSPSDWQVTLTLDNATGALFAQQTADAVARERNIDHSDATQRKDQLAFVNDGAVVAAPAIQAVITDGNVSIYGNFTEQTAKAFAAQVTARSVPSDVSIESDPLPTPSASASLDAACEARPMAYLASTSGSQPLASLASVIRERVAALTSDGCVETSSNNVIIRLGGAGTLAVTAASLRSDLWLAPVTAQCDSNCSTFGKPITVYSSDPHAYPQGAVYTVDDTRKLVLDGHIVSAHAQLQTTGDWTVALVMDSTAAAAFGALTTQVVGAASPGNQLALIDHGKTLTAPVIQSAITDGNVTISGSLTEQEANMLASRLGAPAIPANVQIRAVPADAPAP